MSLGRRAGGALGDDLTNEIEEGDEKSGAERKPCKPSDKKPPRYNRQRVSPIAIVGK